MESIIRHLPNAISATRIPLALAFPFVDLYAQIAVIVAAGLSDILDGYLARRIHNPAEHGNLIDPITDKTFVFVVFLTLIVQSHFTLVEFVAIALRDLSVLIGSLVLLIFDRSRLVEDVVARWPGKLTTLLQFTVLLWLLIIGPVPLTLLLITAVVSALAGLDYISSFRRLLRVTKSPTVS